MDAAKEERKVDTAAPTAAKATDPEVQAGSGGGQQAKRERAKPAAPPKSNGIPFVPSTGPEDAVPVVDGHAHEVVQAVSDVSQASLGAMQAAAEATVEMAHHAFALAEKQAARAIEAAVGPKAEDTAPKATQAGPKAASAAPTPEAARSRPGDAGATTRAAGISWEPSYLAGTTFFDVFVESAEASLRAALEVQTAALSAGLSMLEAANSVNRELARQWAAMAHEAQESALAAWRSSFQAAGGASPRDK